MNFDTMNETDVREIVVRPWLHALGYRQGSENDIVSEKSLRYPRLSLGRKKKSDPVLAGRADYVCQVTSFGRWVVEVKAPFVDLTSDDAEQAHTYAAHPDIAALYYVLTNGREFKLFRTSHPHAPDLSWKFSETAGLMPILANVLGPASIKKRVMATKPDTNLPLGPNLPSSLQLVGGFVTYIDHETNNPLVVIPESTKGSRATVVGDSVSRTESGLIRVHLTLAGPNSLWDYLNRLGGIEGYTFETADEFISEDSERPTIFQNYLEATIKAGTIIPAIPGQTQQPMQLPCDLFWSASTEAAGYLVDGKFIGDFGIAYETRFALLGQEHLIEYSGYGIFQVVARP